MAKNKQIPDRGWNESVISYCKRIAAMFPKMLKKQIQDIATRTTRIRRSCYSPNYGAQASARNLRHAQNRTHGLAMSNKGICFAGKW